MCLSWTITRPMARAVVSRVRRQPFAIACCDSQWQAWARLGLARRHRLVLARQYDYLINLDADQSHDPASAPQLLDVCIENSVRDASMQGRVVGIGSRYVAGGASTGLSYIRSAMSRALNLYASKLLRLPVRDCSGSYRCYPVALLRQVQLDQLHCNGYGFLEEILVHLQQAGAIFREVPITYHARGSGSSKLSSRDALGAIAVIHRLAFTPARRITPANRSTPASRMR